MKRVIFAGNRFNVLKEVLNTGMKIVDIFCEKDSILEKELNDRGIDYRTLGAKDDFFAAVIKTDFDIFISNGLVFKVPVSRIKREHQVFINIHPSLLPNLKGMNPINGAMLFGKGAGATCHIMNDDIDSGRIIEQVEIKLTEDLDLGLLYQLSFMAEAEVFKKAYTKNFTPLKFRQLSKGGSYYTRKIADLSINFIEPQDKIIKKIKAFGIKVQGANFVFKKHTYKVLDAEEVKNDYLLSKLKEFKELEVVFVYESNVLVKKGDCFLKLKNVIGDMSVIRPGDILKC
ncbi:MAG: formyltransferase family protein [Candidatus Omnitrophica bacterium]|jgi:methionyl-tRNA formyltransferase|nr:formyltransferase family protein [Candidatus Omnitrophota bacterium]